MSSSSKYGEYSEDDVLAVVKEVQRIVGSKGVYHIPWDRVAEAVDKPVPAVQQMWRWAAYGRKMAADEDSDY